MENNIKPYYDKDNIIIYNNNCFDILPYLEKESINLFFTDMPYNITACKWDKEIINLNKLWDNILPLGMQNTPFVFTAMQPFSSKLVMSNLKMFKYEWVWNKKRITAPFLAKKQPLRQHELILVFYKKQCTYNPQPTKKSTGKPFSDKEMTDGKGEVYGGMKRNGIRGGNEYGYPKSILNDIPVITNMSKEKFIHPTQKPVSLMEYLIKTYTNEGDLVLDPFGGSFTTAVACKKLNRKFIGIEILKEYCDIGIKRINEIK